jgi:hypothetical protein
VPLDRLEVAAREELVEEDPQVAGPGEDVVVEPVDVANPNAAIGRGGRHDLHDAVALECFVPSYIRARTPTFAAGWFHSSRSVFAIQRFSRFRAVGFGQRAMRCRSISSFEISRSRHSIQRVVTETMPCRIIISPACSARSGSPRFPSRRTPEVSSRRGTRRG